MKAGLLAHRYLGVGRVAIPGALEHTRRLVESGEVATALDIGCGSYSHLTRFRPRVRTVGVDAFAPAIDEARRSDTHDRYIVADVLNDDLEVVLAANGGERFDLVTLYGVIEHVPKAQGFRLLERCEQLTRKYVLLETPNGFVEQGPEFGNEFQRHLSGWFAHDFMGLGYRVYGTTGTRYLLGYATRPRVRFPGVLTLDTLLARALAAHRRPRHAFNLLAIKDVRGVPARLGPTPEAS